MGCLVARMVMGALVAAAIALASHAQDLAPPSLLSPAIIENFIASYPQVKAKVGELSTQYDVSGEVSGTAAWRAWAGVDGARSQLDAIVQLYDFPDFSAWVRTLSVAAQAYAFTQSGVDLDSKMAEALARTERSRDIPEEQKEMMRQQLRHSVDAITAMKPSKGNIDAVTPYAEELGRLFDE